MFAVVVDLLEGDEELGRDVRHPAATEQAVKEVGTGDVLMIRDARVSGSRRGAGRSR
jgi:hypothetical protein